MSDKNVESHSKSSAPETWEREIIHKMVMASVMESRRSRRWGIFFKLLTFAYFTLLLVLLMWSDELDMSQATLTEHTAMVEVSGLIAPDTKASADKVVTGLRNAFEDKKTKEGKQCYQCKDKPQECKDLSFIDKRDFDSFEEIYNFMKNMKQHTYMRYIYAIENFLNSSRADAFRAKTFANTIVNEIVKDLKKY